MLLQLLMLLLLLVLITTSQQQVRQLHWRRSTNFSDDSNWSRGRVPWTNESVLLYDNARVSLRSSVSISQMTLLGDSIVSLYHGGSISAPPHLPSPSHETKWLQQEFSAPTNWRTESTLSLLDYESAPCIGDSLVFERPEDVVVMKKMPPLTLHSIIIYPFHHEPWVVANHSSIDTLQHYYHNSFQMALPLSNLTIAHITCGPGCDCVAQNMQRYKRLCSFLACLPVLNCSHSFTPYGQCCPLCALVHIYNIKQLCIPFDFIKQELTKPISHHSKFTSLSRKATVSVSYIGDLKTQVTWSGINDGDVRIAEEIMASLPHTNHCWELMKVQSSLPQTHLPPPSHQAHTHRLGTYIFFSSFFIFIIITVYVMRHRIRSRYIPRVMEVVEGVMERWRGGRVATIEMGGGVIFDNSSVFDVRDEQSVGSGLESLVNHDFLASNPTPSKSTKKKRGFSNPAFHEGVKEDGPTNKLNEGKMDDRNDGKKDEIKEEEPSNTFFNI